MITGLIASGLGFATQGIGTPAVTALERLGPGYYHVAFTTGTVSANQLIFQITDYNKVYTFKSDQNGNYSYGNNQAVQIWLEVKDKK